MNLTADSSIWYENQPQRQLWRCGEMRDDQDCKDSLKNRPSVPKLRGGTESEDHVVDCLLIQPLTPQLLSNLLQALLLLRESFRVENYFAGYVVSFDETDQNKK